jgi:hypothetical protein
MAAYYFKVSSLDRLEAMWKETLGTDQVNRAVRIKRVDNALFVLTEAGNLIKYEVK